MSNIKVYKKWFLKKRYCSQCMRPCRTLIIRETPRTKRQYCEPCALEHNLMEKL